MANFGPSLTSDCIFSPLHWHRRSIQLTSGGFSGRNVDHFAGERDRLFGSLLLSTARWWIRWWVALLLCDSLSILTMQQHMKDDFAREIPYIFGAQLRFCIAYARTLYTAGATSRRACKLYVEMKTYIRTEIRQTYNQSVVGHLSLELSLLAIPAR